MSATNYLFDTRDIKFILNEWLDMDKLLAFPTYVNHYGKDDVDLIIDTAFEIAQNKIAPINDGADKIVIRFIDGRVIAPDSFKLAYQAFNDSGLGAKYSDREAQGHLPYVIVGATFEMFSGACAAFSAFWLLNSYTISVIQTYGSDFIKQKFLPKMFSGDWGGTMHLTEPTAIFDVDAAVPKAFPTDEPGIYKIKGHHTLITAGDHDLTENIIHLVLAQTEGVFGVGAGLSLFVVPKYWVNGDNSIGEFNDVTCIGIEGKMGLYGSPTCSLSYGENGHCRGYLIGIPPDGKGKGTAHMLTMMNEASLFSGLMGLSGTSKAYYKAREYAKERFQGAEITDSKGERVRIIEHEDIRHMLMLQKSYVEVIRALIIKTCYYLDLSYDSTDPKEREFADGMFQISNTLCKAYSTDISWSLIVNTLQPYGGYGFASEYNALQLTRDSKVHPIWAGTNFIQAMDLVGHKFTIKNGQVFKTWMEEIARFIEVNTDVSGFEHEFGLLQNAHTDFIAIVHQLQRFYHDGKIQIISLFATRILHASSMLYCGILIMDQAILADHKLKELGEGNHDAKFYKGKIASARFYIKNVIPNIAALRRQFIICDTTAIELEEECF